MDAESTNSPEGWKTVGTRPVMDVDFGFNDERGRRVGCRLSFWHVDERAEQTDPWGTVWPAIPAHFVSTVQSTRNGYKFGALARYKDHDPAATIDEVKADLLKRAEQSRKRQKKQFDGK